MHGTTFSNLLLSTDCISDMYKGLAGYDGDYNNK